MSCKELNITNGEYFNDYIKSKQDGLFIPFNEALLQGKPSYPLFTKEFILERTITHFHTLDEVNKYVGKMDLFVNKSEDINQYEKITLWFGEDTFCLVNLLGALTFLEQIGYKNDVYLNTIDDETCEVLSNKIICLGNFSDSYKSLFIDNKIKFSGFDLIDKGIKEYFYLKDKENHLYRYIKENKDNKSEMELLISLLEMTKNYGLSDLIIVDMIKECK